MKEHSKTKLRRAVAMSVATLCALAASAIAEQRPKPAKPVEIGSLPKGVPIALTRLDANHIGYGSSVSIPAIGAFFEKFYSIDLATKETKDINREEFYTMMTTDQKAQLVWEETFGFTYVADGNKLKQVEYSKSIIKYNDVSGDWREIASYSNKVEMVVLSPDGRSVLVAMDGKVHLLKPSADSRVLLSSEGMQYADPVYGGSSAYFYVKAAATKGRDRAIVICDAESGKTSIVVSEPNMLSFNVSPDGKFLAYVDGTSRVKRIRVLALSDKKVLTEIEHEESNVVGNPLLIFSSDSSALYFTKHGSKGGVLFRLDVRLGN